MIDDRTTPELRLLRRVMNKLAQIFALAEPDIGDDWYRAGNLDCEACGQDYHSHPQDPREPWLTIICGGQRVKL